VASRTVACLPVGEQRARVVRAFSLLYHQRTGGRANWCGDAAALTFNETLCRLNHILVRFPAGG